MEAGPHTTIQAMDMLIRRGQETHDFSAEELAKIRKVRELCVKDVELIQEAHTILAKQKHRLARKEQSLSAFMEKLTPEDLESPIIKKMLEYFMLGHIELDDRICKIERMLASMYPHRDNRRSGASHKEVVKESVDAWRSVDMQLDEVLTAMDGGEKEVLRSESEESSEGGARSTGTQTSEDDVLDVTQSSLDLDDSDPAV